MIELAVILLSDLALVLALKLAIVIVYPLMLVLTILGFTLVLVHHLIPVFGGSVSSFTVSLFLVGPVFVLGPDLVWVWFLFSFIVLPLAWFSSASCSCSKSDLFLVKKKGEQEFFPLWS